MRTNVLLLSHGYTDLCDVNRLRKDPAIRVGMDQRRGVTPLDEGNELASQSTLSRARATLSSNENQEALREGIIEMAAQTQRYRTGRDKLERTMVMDVDGLPIEAHGHQPGVKYNGHYGMYMHYPLVASRGETGDMLGVKPRAGNAAAGEGALDFITDITGRCIGRLCKSVIARMDAGFSDGKLFSALEERDIDYVTRLRCNKVLDRLAGGLLKQPRGLRWIKPRTWCHELRYKANSWKRGRRVVPVVVERPGELFCRHFYLVTSLDKKRYSAIKLLKLYRKRGAAEGHMGEFKDVLAPSLSSTYRPKSHYRGCKLEQPDNRQPEGIHPHNETQLLLNMLAYQIMHIGRCMMKEKTGKGWSLRKFRERVLNAAALVTVHSRKIKFILCRASMPYWNRLWMKFERLRYAAG